MAEADVTSWAQPSYGTRGAGAVLVLLASPYLRNVCIAGPSQAMEAQWQVVPHLSVCPACARCQSWRAGWEPGSGDVPCWGCWHWGSPSAPMARAILGISPLAPSQSLPALGSPRLGDTLLRGPEMGSAWALSLPQTGASPSTLAAEQPQTEQEAKDETRAEMQGTGRPQTTNQPRGGSENKRSDCK